MILYINVSEKVRVSASLKDGQRVIDSLSDDNKFGSQALLPLIDKLLQKNKLNVNDLDQIEVSCDQGSYTGLRVGVSIANALGFALNIPVNGKAIETEISY